MPGATSTWEHGSTGNVVVHYGLRLSLPPTTSKKSFRLFLDRWSFDSCCKLSWFPIPVQNLFPTSLGHPGTRNWSIPTCPPHLLPELSFTILVAPILGKLDNYIFSKSHQLYLNLAGVWSEVVGWAVRKSNMEKAHRLVKLPDRPMFGYWCSYGSSQTHNCKERCQIYKTISQEGRRHGLFWIKAVEINWEARLFRKTITAFVFDVFAKTWPKKHVVTL